MAQEMEIGLSMTNSMMDASSRVIEALIAALSAAGNKPEDESILKEFEQYTQNGGELLSIPVDKNIASAFEQTLDESVMMYRTESAKKPNVYTYIFKQEDLEKVDETILALKNKDIEVLKSCKVDYTELERSGKDIYVSNVLDKEEANKATLILDTYSVPYSCMESTDKQTIYMIVDDYEKVKNIPEFKVDMQNSNAKKTMEDIFEIIRKADKEREERKKEREKSKKSSRGRDYEDY